MEQGLALYEPLLAEFDALWADPVSRAHMQSGRLFRPKTAKLMGPRECFNLLTARAIHDGRDLGDRPACERDCEEALAYSHSLGTDWVGFEVGWAGEAILVGGLRQLACEDAGPTERIGSLLGTLTIPYDLERLLPEARGQYARQAVESRALLAAR
jgi:hypothetical protein